MSQQLIGGFLESCIADVYSYLPDFFADMHLLLTVRDSGTKTIFAPDGLTLNVDYIDVNGRLFLNAQAVSMFVNQMPFIEFSEVYLIPVFDPPPIYVAGKFNTDVYNFSDAIPKEFLYTFKQCGASRFLSDGCGLNYYCENHFVKTLGELYSD